MRFFQIIQEHVRQIMRWSPVSQSISRLLFIDVQATNEAIRRNPELAPHWIKVVEALVYSPKSINSIKDYLSRIAHCEFVEHESDIRYGGMYYWRSKQKDFNIVLVHTVYLGWRIPRRYRSLDWFYVKIVCASDETRFDTLSDYTVVPAQHYDIL